MLLDGSHLIHLANVMFDTAVCISRLYTVVFQKKKGIQRIVLEMPSTYIWDWIDRLRLLREPQEISLEFSVSDHIILATGLLFIAGDLEHGYGLLIDHSSYSGPSHLSNNNQHQWPRITNATYF